MGAMDAVRAAHDVGFVAHMGGEGGSGRVAAVGGGVAVPGFAERVTAVGGSP